MEIRIISNNNIEIITPLLLSRGFDIDPELVTARLKEMTTQNYTCVGVFQNERLIGCSGMWIRTNYFIG